MDAFFEAVMVATALLTCFVLLFLGPRAVFRWRIGQDRAGKIVLRCGTVEGNRIVLPAGEYSLGTMRRSDVQVREPGVSFKHARIRITPTGEVLVADCRSANGTFVGNQRIGSEEVEVPLGASVRFGDALLEILPEGSARAISVQAGRTGDRCPYCHATVDPGEAVVCVSCIAHHHLVCWDDHAQCASCAGVERYSGIERTAGRNSSAQAEKA